MERIPNDSVNRVVFFVSVDAVDLYTRETGLSGFTIDYVLDNGARGQMATPTTAAVDDTNLPGLYSLLIDEAAMTNMDDANDSETLVLHVTHASIDPITMKVEIYRPKITVARTLGIDADGALSVCTLNTDMVGTDGANTVEPDAKGVAPTKGEIKTEIEKAGSSLAQILADTGTDGVLLAVDQEVDVTKIAGAVVSTASAQIGANVVSEDNIDFGATKKASLNTATPDLSAITGDKDSYKATSVAVSDKTGFSLSTAGILAIWHQAIASIVTASTIGKKIKDWVLGTDNKVLVSTDAQDLSGTLDVNAKTVGDKTGYSLAADQAVNVTKIEGSDATDQIRDAVLDMHQTELEGSHSIDDTTLTVNDHTGFAAGKLVIITNATAGGSDVVVLLRPIISNTWEIEPALRHNYIDTMPVKCYATRALPVTIAASLSAQAKLDVNAECDSALSDAGVNDPPTRAEATTDKEAIITEVNANETKIDAVPDSVVAALMADTGVTAGDTWTYEKLLKVMAAWFAGKWRDKDGVDGTYEVLDPDDDSTVILEVTPSTSSPQKTIEVLI